MIEEVLRFSHDEEPARKTIEIRPGMFEER